MYVDRQIDGRQIDREIDRWIDIQIDKSIADRIHCKELNSNLDFVVIAMQYGLIPSLNFKQLIIIFEKGPTIFQCFNQA